MLRPIVFLLGLLVLSVMIQLVIVKIYIKDTDLVKSAKIKGASLCSGGVYFALLFVLVGIRDWWGYDDLLYRITGGIPNLWYAGIALWLFILAIFYSLNIILPKYLVNKKIRKVGAGYFCYLQVNIPLILVSMVQFALCIALFYFSFLMDNPIIRWLVLYGSVYLVLLLFSLLQAFFLRLGFGQSSGDQDILEAFAREAKKTFEYSLKKVVMLKTKKFKLANAFIFGVFRPVLYVTDTLVEGLTEMELFAVIGHEIGHIKRGHLFKIAALVSLGIVLSFGVYDGIHQLLNVDTFLLDWIEFPLFVLLMITNVYILPNIYRRRAEREADVFAFSHLPNPLALADALEKITQLNDGSLKGNIVDRLGTHPFTQERIRLIHEKMSTSD